MVPMLFGLVVAIVSFWGYRYWNRRIGDLDQEMQTASVELANRLVLHLRKGGNTNATYFSLISRRNRGLRRILTWRTDGSAPDPRLEAERSYGNGFLELLCPRLTSGLDADGVLANGMWILFAYAVIAWLTCIAQRRPVAGAIVGAFLALLGLAVRAGSRRAINGAYLFFALACVACFIPFGLAASSACLALAPLFLIGCSRAVRYPADTQDSTMRVKQLWTAPAPLPSFTLALLGISAAFAILFATILTHYSMAGDKSMEPNLHVGDWIVGLSDPLLGRVDRGQLVSFSYWGGTGIERVAGLPGDRIEVRSGRLIRNGRQVSEPYCRRVYRGYEGDFPLPSEAYRNQGIRWQHRIAYGDALRTDTIYVVPRGSYFLLNDD